MFNQRMVAENMGSPKSAASQFDASVVGGYWLVNDS